MFDHAATLKAAFERALHKRTDGKTRSGWVDALDAQFKSPSVLVQRFPLAWALKARVNQLRRPQRQTAPGREDLAERSSYTRVWLHAPPEIIWQPRDAPACVCFHTS